jgi:predicted chitinase
MATPAQLAKIGNTNTRILARSVGRGGHNGPIDVAVVQWLLNAYSQSTAKPPANPFFPATPLFQPAPFFQPAWSLPSGPVFPSAPLFPSAPPIEPAAAKKIDIDGETSPQLFDAIIEFQRQVMKMKQPDGLIDPAKKTVAALAGYAGGNFVPALFQSPTTASWHMSTERFASLYGRHFGQPSAASLAGLKSLFNNILYDEDIYDIRWGAYMLATVKRETGTFLPIEEDPALWGQHVGPGQYAREITIKDETGANVTNRYYGRGYIQLTWQDNYRKLGERLGLERALEYHPENAMDSDTAYAIASIGMREGLFRHDTQNRVETLSRYIQGAFCDYHNARNIINGALDAADEIEKYAIAFECLMLLSQY